METTQPTIYESVFKYVFKVRLYELGSSLLNLTQITATATAHTLK